MTTAELAELQAEQTPPLSFPHWAVVRYSAAALYVVALVACTVAYGIPLQRELVIAWICGGLACASIGRSWREIVQLVLDWLPLAAVLLAYDFTRGAADSFGIAPHFTTMIDFDRFVFFGETPTEWLQAQIYDAGTSTGGTSASRSSTPRTSSSPSRSRARSGPATATRSCSSAKRFVTLAWPVWRPTSLFPAAPPWMASEQGLLDGVPRTTGRGWEVLGVHTAATVLRRARGSSTWWPRFLRCTRPSSPWSPVPLVAGAAGSGGRFSRSIRWRWG